MEDRRHLHRESHNRERRKRERVSPDAVEVDGEQRDFDPLNVYDCRMMKREKLRKSMKACMWRITPSPPHEDVSFGERGTHEHNGAPIASLDCSAADTVGEELVGRQSDIEEVSNRILNAGVRSQEPPRFDNGSSRQKVKKPDAKRGEDSSFEIDGSGERRRRHESRSLCRHRSRKSSKVYVSESSEDDTSSEVVEGEISSSGSDGMLRKVKSMKRKQRKGTSRRKHRTFSSARDKKSKKHHHHSSFSDHFEADDVLTLSATCEKLDASSPLPSGRAFKDSLTNQSDGGTGRDEDAAVKIDEATQLKVLREALEKSAAGVENEPIVGPAPACPRAEGRIRYGGALRPGEGDAIAQYVQQGKRIPRRGEVGLSADDIQKFEGLGYVMSGSRHKHMTAIRIRKENQVYSAEEKYALTMFSHEEKAKREFKVMSLLRRLVQQHVGQDVGSR